MSESNEKPQGYPVAWNQHHVFINGEPVAVVALSPAEAKNALCAALDTLQEIRIKLEGLETIITQKHGHG